MSNNIVSAGASFGTLIGDKVANYALITPGARSIATLYPHVVVEEDHHDELAITQHPVEFGTPVTDHSFMQPYTVEIRCGWSDSTAQTSGYVQAVYKALLALQSSRQPFAIATGKRQYSSMLMRAVAVKTDPDSEFTLMVVASAQQIVITNTQAGSATPANTNGSSTQPVNPTGVPSSPVAANQGSTTGPDMGFTPWANDVSGAGTQSLTVADPGAPTVESLTASGGV